MRPSLRFVRRPFRLSIFAGANTRPGRASDEAVASLRTSPVTCGDSPWGACGLHFVSSGGLFAFLYLLVQIPGPVAPLTRQSLRSETIKSIVAEK